MRKPLALVLLGIAAAAPQLPHDDVVRVGEFYRLASDVREHIWPGWSRTPAPLLLVTAETEFLTHSAAAPKEFTRIDDDLYARPRQFPTNLLATFPAFGPPAVIVIGEPENTEAKTSTRWLIVLMHEHFHQFQYGHPGYYGAVNDLGLSRGDNSGMWMLNYPFPYDKPEVADRFARLRDLLLRALNESNQGAFNQRAAEYVREREHAFGQLSPDDHKYISFQLWQEGIARYVQIKSAEAAATYDPTSAYKALPDYESFSDYAPRARGDTLTELARADLPKMKRVFLYSFGAAEGLLLDRLNPKWKEAYFTHVLTTDPLFESR